MYMSVLPACISVYHACVWCLQRPEEEIRSPGIGVTDNCKPPCGCRELNSGPLEEQAMLLIAEPSLQLPNSFFSK